MKINPKPFILWAFCACIGYLCGNVIAGLAVGLGISVIAELFF